MLVAVADQLAVEKKSHSVPIVNDKAKHAIIVFGSTGVEGPNARPLNSQAASRAVGAPLLGSLMLPQAVSAVQIRRAIQNIKCLRMSSTVLTLAVWAP